jgi:hypothetical protein
MVMAMEINMAMAMDMLKKKSEISRI